MVSDKTKRIIRVLVLSAILLLVMIQFTQTIGLVAKGFDSEAVLKQFFFYNSPGIGFLLGILIIFGIELMIIKDDDKYGSSLAFASQGETPALPFFKRFTSMQILMLSLIIFSTSGLVFVLVNQQSFTGLAVLPQQFTPTSSIAFSTLLVVISENLGMAFTIAISLMFLRFVSRRFNISKTNFIILAFIIALLVGTIGLGNHLLRYQDSEIAKFTVFAFWTISGFITLGVGSFIPAAVMHGANNVFVDLIRFFASDSIRNVTIGVIALFILLYFVIYRGRWLGKKSK